MRLFQRRSLRSETSPETRPKLFPVGPRIANGVRRVESVFGPDWRCRVDEKRLNIGSDGRCIAAQVSGSDYETGCRELGINPASNEPAMHGFNIMNHSSSDTEKMRECEALNRGWRLALKISSIKAIKRIVVAA